MLFRSPVDLCLGEREKELLVIIWKNQARVGLVVEDYLLEIIDPHSNPFFSLQSEAVELWTAVEVVLTWDLVQVESFDHVRSFHRLCDIQPSRVMVVCSSVEYDSFRHLQCQLWSRI